MTGHNNVARLESPFSLLQASRLGVRNGMQKKKGVAWDEVGMNSRGLSAPKFSPHCLHCLATVFRAAP